MQKQKIGMLFQVTDFFIILFNHGRFKAPSTVKGLNKALVSSQCSIVAMLKIQQ